jgi:hypothetical protein
MIVRVLASEVVRRLAGRHGSSEVIPDVHMAAELRLRQRKSSGCEADNRVHVRKDGALLSSRSAVARLEGAALTVFDTTFGRLGCASSGDLAMVHDG